MRVLIRGCSIVHCLFPDSELGPEQGKSRVWGVSTPHTITVSRLQVGFRTIKETSPLSAEEPKCLQCTPPSLVKAPVSHDLHSAEDNEALFALQLPSESWCARRQWRPYHSLLQFFPLICVIFVVTIYHQIFVCLDRPQHKIHKEPCVRCPNLNGNTSL